MIYLADFSVIKPDVGLFFWTVIFFAIFWFLMSKFAFKPIANALKKREHDIQEALDEAKRAKEEMSNLKAENEKLLAEARAEKASILKEANDIKNEIVTEAKVKAKSEAQKIVTSAKEEIDNQKKAAITEVKNSVGMMAIEIAEKVIKKELKGNSEHESFVSKLVDDIKLN